MNLDAGTLTICNLINTAARGEMPKQALTPVARHWYGELTAGVTRIYAAMGANQQIDLLARIHADRSVRAGQYAVLGNGEQYRIDVVQQLVDDNGLRVTNLTLSKLGELYDVVSD